MATQSRFSKLLTKHRFELEQLQAKSKGWYTRQVNQMVDVRSIRPETLMRGDEESKGNVIIPGHMYMFIYDPKWKDVLPYYDRFPLVFPFRSLKGGFLGLNLHYLPYQYRAYLLDNLMDFRTNNRLNEHTKLKFSWQLISNAAQFEVAKPCVKHYLYDHVRTQFKAVHSQDWATVLMLPVERFEKATAQQVWAESVRSIHRRL